MDPDTLPSLLCIVAAVASVVGAGVLAVLALRERA